MFERFKPATNLTNLISCNKNIWQTTLQQKYFQRIFQKIIWPMILEQQCSLSPRPMRVWRPHKTGSRGHLNLSPQWSMGWGIPVTKVYMGGCAVLMLKVSTLPAPTNALLVVATLSNRWWERGRLLKVWIKRWHSIEMKICLVWYACSLTLWKLHWKWEINFWASFYWYKKVRSFEGGQCWHECLDFVSWVEILRANACMLGDECPDVGKANNELERNTGGRIDTHSNLLEIYSLKLFLSSSLFSFCWLSCAHYDASPPPAT